MEVSGFGEGPPPPRFAVVLPCGAASRRHQSDNALDHQTIGSELNHGNSYTSQEPLRC